MGDDIGTIIAGIFIAIAVASVLIIGLGFIALFNTDVHWPCFDFANDFFQFFGCDVDCISNAMGIALVVLIFGGAIGAFTLYNSQD